MREGGYSVMWSFITLALREVDQNGKVREDEMFATCNKNGTEKTRIKTFSKNLR
jgi:hypothetical protein